MLANALQFQRHPLTPRGRLAAWQARRDAGDEAQHRGDQSQKRPSNDPPQIFSYYLPPLETGAYSIDITQKVSANSTSESLTLSANKKFEVVAPHFALPPNAVHSTYPPQGHHDNVDILPHIAFNDPHLPWQRGVSTVVKNDRNRVPWLALLTFTQDELQIPDSVSKTPGAAMSVHLNTSDVLELENVATPLKNIDAGGEADIIFVRPDIFTAYVTTFNKDGTATKGQKHPDISRYKHLAHSRIIQTDGMAQSGASGQLLDMKSIVISHRTAPLDTTQPKTVVVHLVSLEGVEQMDFSTGSATAVALTSLYGWIYTSMPPGSLNAHDLFKNIGQSIDLLRAPESITSRSNTAYPIVRRLLDGYTLTKYRTKTGEITAAITRGPFTPCKVPHPLKQHWTLMSNSGESLQILDRELRMMDISYSAAWNLGKSLAIGDKAFSAALCRFRSTIHDSAMAKVKSNIMARRGSFVPRDDAISSMLSLPQFLGQLHQEHEDEGGQRPSMPESRRWYGPRENSVNLSFSSPHVRAMFHNQASKVARKVAMEHETPYDTQPTPDEPNTTPGGPTTSHSPDWPLILNWIMDRMFLCSIPAHYLITDPSHLPSESLRFFHIDANWIDALVDGALSIANHIGTDSVRSAIKSLVNHHLHHGHDGKRPQIPTYGFLMRSKLVTIFPDLKVDAPRPAGDDQPPILRQDIIAGDVMLCLLDRKPSPDFETLTFTQPAHQLSFAAAASITQDHFTIEYKRVYTAKVDDPYYDKPLRSRTWYRNSADPVFVWGDSLQTRMFLFPAWAQNVFGTISAGMSGYERGGQEDWFTDSGPSSALNAIQLSNPAYRLNIRQVQNQATGSQSHPGPGDGGPNQHGGIGDPRGGDETRDGHEDLRQLKLLAVPLPSSVETPSSSSLLSSAGTRMPYVQALADARQMPESQPHGLALRNQVILRPSHFPRLIAKTLVAASATVSPAGDDDDSGITVPSSLPQLTISVHAAGKGPGSSVPSKSTVLDLIFSVVVTPDTQTSYFLRELRFTIRLAGSGALMSNYHGPGATMLSNLRFYSLCQFSSDGGELYVRLLPRSTKGQVAVSKLAEMSFMLALVELNACDGETVVELDCMAVYDSDSHKSKVQVKLSGDSS